MQREKEIWLDAQLSPYITSFITEICGITCKAIRDINLRDAEDSVIFNRAKKEHKLIVIMTKDSDFVDWVIRKGNPPKIILLTCGNTSNENLQKILSERLMEALELLENPENEIVEISE